MARLADIPEPERTVIADLDCPVYADTPPVTAVAKALRHVAIVSTAGFILRGERPMLSNETGYRAIAATVGDGDILCSHVSTNFDRTGFQQDLNVMLPRDRLRELEDRGIIGKAADTHYAFMGATSPEKLEDKARELGRSMLALGVNTVVLAPVWPACTRAVSGLAHYLEDEGLATVIVALVREHIVCMRPPRALWVPFELGRPFGAPGNADLQRRVLQASLALLDKEITAPLLEEFNEATLADGGSDGDDNWRFPGALDNSNVLAEAASVVPIWQLACERLGKTSVGISGLAPEAAVEFVERFHSAAPMQNPKGMAPVSRARFSIDDIKALYFEAALAEGGHPSTQQLHDWFWSGTLAGALLRDFQERARVSDDKNLRLIASSLVPAERTYWFLNGLESP